MAIQFCFYFFFETERYITRELKTGTHRILPAAALHSCQPDTGTGGPLQARAPPKTSRTPKQTKQEQQQSTTRQATP